MPAVPAPRETELGNTETQYKQNKTVQETGDPSQKEEKENPRVM